MSAKPWRKLRRAEMIAVLRVFILTGTTLLAFSVTNAFAQPRIIFQPTSLAVLLGSNVLLRVTPAGTAPLTFQWRHDGHELVGATNPTLWMSSLGLADLGCYTVVVRDPSGETVSQPAWLKLARWTRLVAFGDSQCMAEYSNGPSWVDQLAELLGLPGNAKQKYAQGSAGTLEVRSQISQYLSANTPDTNTLLAPWWAGVSYDLVGNHHSVMQVVSNYAYNIRLLAEGGGRVMMLPTVAQLYLNPAFSGDPYVTSIDYQDLNARMDQEIQSLQEEFGLTVYRYDVYDLALRVWSDPSAYGFTNVTSEANGCGSCDPNRYFWWDIHFSTAAHRLIAQEMYRMVSPPPVMALETGDTSGVLELRWQGGSPPFRVQSCEHLIHGAWQSEEPTFQRNATISPSATQEFFRVLNLGQ